MALEATPASGFRVVCYCRDCQAFARVLARPDVLDPAGGTDIFQMPMGRVKLTAGIEAVRCLRFSPRVLRWYAECCRTPIGNTAGASVPMIGLVHTFMAARDRDKVLGPPVGHIFARSALGPLPSNSGAAASAGTKVRRAATLLSWWWQGLGRPSPFFDDVTKAPMSPPCDVMPDKLAGP